MRNAYCRPPYATPSLGRVVPQHRAVRPGLPRAAALTLSLLVLAVAALVSAWAWFGARGEVVALPPTASATPTPTPDPGGDATPEVTPAGTATVHVTGAVTVPGVYVLTLGARVDDAIAAAGGLTADADESALNRAQVLTDAQQVYVPVEERPPHPPPERVPERRRRARSISTRRARPSWRNSPESGRRSPARSSPGGRRVGRSPASRTSTTFPASARPSSRRCAPG